MSGFGLVLVALAVPSAFGADAVLTLSPKGDEMAYDKKALLAKPGQKVRLTFRNTGNMQHNVVVVKPGKASEVAQAGIAAGAAQGWVAIGSGVLKVK